MTKSQICEYFAHNQDQSEYERLWNERAKLIMLNEEHYSQSRANKIARLTKQMEE